MARLRFPGRPGHRFDRISVKYFADDQINIADPSLAFLPRFQSGVKEFRELTGPSDEENDDFEGFTKQDLKNAEKKLKLFLEEEKKRQEEERKRQEEEEEVTARITSLQSSQEKAPADLSRNKKKMGIKHGKSIVIIGGKEIISDRTLSKKKTKMKQFQMDITAAGPKSIIYTEKDRAKFLLEKARQANLLIQQKELKRRLSAGVNKAPVRKQFVLPTQSSRSSRVIKPNKRFIQDEVYNSDIIKKSRLEENLDGSFSPRSIPYVSDSSFCEFSSPKSPDFKGFTNKSPGCFEQPLICDGKRNRKPSLKLRLGTDADSQEAYDRFESHLSAEKSLPTKAGGITSPLAAPKLGTSLFSMQGSQFKKASENQRFGILGLGASRKQGASIVQKAKLQLNRAALNKSKAALARSLKAEMKREAKLAHEAFIQELASPTKEPEKKPEKEEKPKKKRVKKCCAVCKEKMGLCTYVNLLVCCPCRGFYAKSRQRLRANPSYVYHCIEETGECKIKPENKTRCRYCRLKQCIEAGFPHPEDVQAIVSAGPKEKQTDEATSADDSKATDLQAIDSLLKTPPNQGIRSSAQNVTEVPVGSSSKKSQPKVGFEEELSPLKHLEGTEKKQKKRRAFKELLRTKQEKQETSLSEGEDKLAQTPVVIPAIISPVQGSVEESPSPGAPGPRIKHVCRNAAVVLGKPIARFPEKSELRLSALPTKDKVQLWKKEEQSRAATEESDDDRTMEEIIQKSPESVVIIKKSPPEKTKAHRKLRGVGGLKVYKRRMRCRQCDGCMAPDCGKCRYCLDKPKFGGPDKIRQACLDKPKFGGPNTQKQCCVERRCLNPLMKRNPTTTFIRPKDKDSDSNAGSQCGSPEKTEELSSTAAPEEESMGEGEDAVVPGTENSDSTVQGLQSQTGTLVDDNKQIVRVNLDGTTTTGDLGTGTGAFRGTRSSRSGPGREVRPSNPGREVRSSGPGREVSGQGREVRPFGPGREVRALDFNDMPNVQLERISFGRRPGKISSKMMKKPDLYERIPKTQGNNDGQCYPVSLQNVIPASRQWGGVLSQPILHPIKVDFKASCDINTVWTYGLALTMSAAMSVRALCFLCGSAGKHEMIYCNICCEPFHEFCLEDFERPSPEHYDSWCCAKCQYCHVCGRQNNLLQCDRCQNTYHPGCLGPNYPTKPSKRKNIWICSKCVKCKSCGATTPGTESNATWTYDFSLCYECGQLMDKGNFCPICHKCYKDDDWDSKMIQCNMCDSWVHSRCEGLTDEMYEILSYLPEDLSFYCRNCHPKGCPEWERTLKLELQTGLESILHTLILTKSAQYILRQDKKISPPKLKATSDRELSHYGAESESQKKSDTIKSSVSTTQSLCETDKVKVDTEDRTSEVKHDCTVDRENVDNDKCLESAKIKAGSFECESTTNKSENVIRTCNSEVKCSSTSCLNGEGCVGEKEDVEETLSSSCDNKTRNCQEPMEIDDNTNLNKTVTTTTVCDNSENCDKVDTDKPVSETDVSEDKQTSNRIDTLSNGCETSQEKHDNKHSSIINCELRVRVVDCLSEGFKIKDQASSIQKDKIVHAESSPKTKCATKDAGKGDIIERDLAKTTIVDENELNLGNKTDKENRKESENKIDSDTKDKPQKEKKTVHFKVDDSIVRRRETTPESEKEGEQHPMDLMAMAEKMRDGYYKSVALFCEDLLRIIQLYLDNDLETRATRKKAVATAKSIFVKQMEKIFPWFQVKTSRFWYSSKNMPMGMIPDATLPPNKDHTYAQWLERTITPLSPQPSPFKKRAATPIKKIFSAIDEDEGDFHTFLEGEDMRRCMFCLLYSDQDPDDAGRLLYCGQDDWCHVNCALWSAEVYEDNDGGLQNMVEAYSRGKMLKCDLCQRYGATVGCNTRGCKANYHFMCARQDKCRLQEDKKVFCLEHAYHVDGEVLGRNRFRVLRRVFVDTNRVRTVKKSWSKGLAASNIRILSGSCCIESLGRLTDLSDKPKYLQPVDFMSTRIYWSTKDARRRCVYSCRIIEVRPEQMKSPTITIKDMRIVHDESHPDFVPLSRLELSGTDQEASPAAICDKTLDSVVDLTADNSETVSVIEDSHMKSPENSIENPLVTSTSESHMNKSVTVRRSSFSGTGLCDRGKNESQSLSSSWPRSNKKKTNFTNQLDLSLLSPKTLKMLNIKNTSEISSRNSPVSLETTKDDDDFKLLKIADRLNRAAAKSSKFDSGQQRDSRSPSVERFSPLPSASRLAPYRRSLRSSSVDGLEEYNTSRNRSPITSRNNSPVLEKFADLPTRPFSPPYRMLSRSRSLSVDKEIRLSDSISRDHKHSVISDRVLPKFSDSEALRTMTSILRKPSAISACLMSPEPIPVHSSSPVRIHVDPSDVKNLISQKRLNSASVSVTIEETGENESDTPICDNSESSNMKTSQDECKKVLSAHATHRHLEHSNTQPMTSDIVNKDESSTDHTKSAVESGVAVEYDVSEGVTDLTAETTEHTDLGIDEDSEIQETIVVMTDSGESLTDEEAIRIVQEVIESRNSPGENPLILDTVSNENCELLNHSLIDHSNKDINKSETWEDENCYTKKEISLVLNNIAETDNTSELVTLDKDISSTENKLEDSSIIGDNDGERSDSPFVPKIGDSPEGNKLSGISRNVRINRSLKVSEKVDIDERNTGGGAQETNSSNEKESGDRNIPAYDEELNHTGEISENKEIETPICETNNNGIVDLAESVPNKITEESEKNDNSDKSIDSDIDDDSDLELLCELDNPMESESEEEIEDNKNVSEDEKESFTEESEGKDIENVENTEISSEESNTKYDEQVEIGNDSESIEKLIEGNGQFDDRCDQDKFNESDVQIGERSDKDEIDGDDANQVLNPSELKVELKQMFSNTDSDGNIVEQKILNCISVIDKEENANKFEEQQVSCEDKKTLENQSPLSDTEHLHNKPAELTRNESELDEKEENISDTEPGKPNAEPQEIVSHEDGDSQQEKSACTPEKNKCVERTPEKLKTVAEDERSGSEKREVLRGLGLWTCDEVEKIKNSPPKNSSPVKIFESTKRELRTERKRRFLKKSPLKIYPLRKSIVSPVRKDDTENFSKSSPTKSPTESQSSLPVLDPISKRIKEESIAKSCPEDKGPFKCPTCRRLYRTETSYQTHVQNCTFYVSSSDEDTNDSDADRRPTVSKCRKLVEFMRNRKKTRLKNEPVEEQYKRLLKNHTNLPSLNDQNTEKSQHSSLRTSTRNQRLAMEVEEKRIQEALKDGVQRLRGRPSLKAPVNNSKESKSSRSQKLDTSVDSQDEDSSIKRGRGRPPKSSTPVSESRCRQFGRSSSEGSGTGKLSTSSLEIVSEGKASCRAMRRVSRERSRPDYEKENAETLSNKLDIKEKPRGRGRPKKNSLSDPEISNEMSPPRRRSQTRETSLGKRKNEVKIDEQLSCRNVKKKCNGLNTSNSKLVSPDSEMKKGRGRPRKMTDSELDRSDDRTEDSKLNERIVKRGRGRPRLVDKVVVSSNDLSIKENSQPENTTVKRGRSRPPRSSLGKLNELNSSDGKETEESESEMEVIDITQSDSEELDNPGSEVAEEMEQEFSDLEFIDDNTGADSSFESVEDILDPGTGLLVNKSTGETVCPSEKYKDKDNIEDDRIEENDTLPNGEIQESDIDYNDKSKNNCNYFQEETNSLKVPDNPGHGLIDIDKPISENSELLNDELDIEKTEHPGHSNKTDKCQTGSNGQDSSFSELDIEKTDNPGHSNKTDKCLTRSNDQDSSSSTVNIIKSCNESNGKEQDGEKPIFSPNTITKTIGEGLPAEDIPKAVLKLLKDGHKVVIKNPKLNKSFLWQKTEKGYLGKVLETSALEAVEANNSENVERTNVSAKDRDGNVVSKENLKMEKCAVRKMPKDVPDSVRKSSPENLIEEKMNRNTCDKRHGIDACKMTRPSPGQSNENNKNTIEKGKEKIQKVPSFTPLRAEYMCGVMIDTKKNKTPSPQVQEMLMNSAFMAGKVLQKTILQRNSGTVTSKQDVQTSEIKIAPKVSPPKEQLRSILLSPPANTTPVATSNLISMGNADMLNLSSVSLSTSGDWKSNVVGSLSGNLLQLTSNQQMLMQQALQPCIQSAPFPQFAQTGLHTLTGAQAALGFSLMQAPSQPSILQHHMSPPQAVSISQTPILQQQLTSSPTMPANISFTASPDVMNVRTVNPCGQGSPQIATVAIQQVTARIHPQVQPHIPQITPARAYTPNQSLPCTIVNPLQTYSIPNPVPQVTISPIPLKPTTSTVSASIVSPTTNSTQATNPLPSPRSMKYEKMRKFLMQRALLPVAKANLPGLDKSKKPIVTLNNTSNGIVKGQYGNLSHKPGYQKITKPVRAKKEPLRRRWKLKKNRLGDLAGQTAAKPHVIDKASHPIIHPVKEVTSLPAAAIELEVQDSPLTDLAESENAGSSTENHNLGRLEFEITSDDGFSCRSETLDGAWKQLTEKVQDARSAERLKQLSYSGLSSYQMFGLSLPNVMYHVEQLYGANYCRKYKFKYHKHELAEQELELMNPTGCIRTEPYSGRNPFDMFSFLLSRYRMLPHRRTARTQDEEMVLKSSRRATSMDLPMAMRFRKLKEHSKEAVGVYRSGIHGRGLFCKRNIDAGEMIIEYSGELIRNSLTDSREKYYESKGIGCYMFRIDDVDVVDATMKGSAARFINHSCEPNCYSKVITVDNRKHIVIFAMNAITRGEELTYDYKFPIEEVKIPCTCGSRKCRKYLN